MLSSFAAECQDSCSLPGRVGALERRLATAGWQVAAALLRDVSAELDLDVHKPTILFTAGTPAVKGRVSLGRAVRDAVSLLVLLADEPQLPTSCCRTRTEWLSMSECMLAQYCRVTAAGAAVACAASHLATNSREVDPNPEDNPEDSLSPFELAEEGAPQRMLLHPVVERLFDELEESPPGRDDEEDDQEYALRSLSLAQRASFVSIVLIWVLRTSMEHAALLSELSTGLSPLAPQELCLLSRLWERHDHDLSGGVASSDLPWLLSDLFNGGAGSVDAPTAEEVALLVAELTDGSSRPARLADLVRWFTAT